MKTEQDSKLLAAGKTERPKKNSWLLLMHTAFLRFVYKIQAAKGSYIRLRTCASMSAGISPPACPFSCKCLATLTAIDTDTSRNRERGGYRLPAARDSASTSAASVAAAASRQDSSILVALAARAPRPRPGKTYALLPGRNH
jgi:hypothetical protein